MERKWSIQAMSFRPNPFHANYILNVYSISYMYLNKILFKPNQHWFHRDNVIMSVFVKNTKGILVFQKRN